ncbi:hypothetical protein NMY22_g12553 [Coprinellus aureogranulatus]|nr:hypothetical protein NMY22_g12553 [Coprinellus aureogranulatus]
MSRSSAAPPREAHVGRRRVRYQPVLQRIRGLLFDSSSVRATLVSVPTLANSRGTQRFPCVEALLGTSAPVHDCTVMVADGQGNEVQFLISCQGGAYLRTNRPLRVLAPQAHWTGSVLVLKMGRRTSFITMGAQDKDLATEAVLKPASTLLYNIPMITILFTSVVYLPVLPVSRLRTNPKVSTAAVQASSQEKAKVNDASRAVARPLRNPELFEGASLDVPWIDVLVTRSQPGSVAVRLLQWLRLVLAKDQISSLWSYSLRIPRLLEGTAIDKLSRELSTKSAQTRARGAG